MVAYTLSGAHDPILQGSEGDSWELLGRGGSTELSKSLPDGRDGVECISCQLVLKDTPRRVNELSEKDWAAGGQFRPRTRQTRSGS